MNRYPGFIACALSLATSCVPRGDLDAAARGTAAPPSESTGGSNSEDPGGGGSGGSGAASVVASSAGSDAAGLSGGAAGGGAAIESAEAGAGAAAGTVSPDLPIWRQDLPIDIPDSPVDGDVSITGDAVWEISGVKEPTFEVHTPTANYWLVKSMGALVSVTDSAPSDVRQWIGYSSFRSRRAVPSYPAMDSGPAFTTVLDPESQTPHHVRLRSESSAAGLVLVWDFYLTHVTVTVESAPSGFAFSYRGVPAGSLDSTDRLVTSDGVEHAPFSSLQLDFPGKPEWVALTDPLVGRALFLVHHADDDVADLYRVEDNDSALLRFGAVPSTPVRFSLGLLDHADFSSIQARVQFVDTAMR